MASLPEGWESDYDGSRWFFRYRSTGIIQYTFPKPGDEFPEYVDASAPPIDLPPEERLVSQQQLKRRSTTGEQSTQTPSTRSKDEVVSATLAKGEGGGFWFQPDYMYLGPGSYIDISPLQEYDEEEDLGLAGGASRDKGAPTDTRASPGQDGARLHTSPLTSADGTPLTGNSQLATGTPELGSAVAAQRVQPSPLGVVPELPSETTAQCREETHPAPVELPGHAMMLEEEQPMVYANAFDIAPVELPAHGTPPGRREQGEDQKVLSPEVQGGRSGHQFHSASISHGQQEQWSRPPMQQSPGPQAGYLPAQSSTTAFDSTAPRYQPYNPTRLSYYPGAVPYNNGADAANKRHTVVPKGGSTPQLPHVPSALIPPQPPPKHPLDGPEPGQQPSAPPVWTSRQTVSGTEAQQQSSTPPNFGGRIPSVLQPARGRPNLPLDTSQTNQRVPVQKDYQPYSPYRELQKKTDNTVALPSRAVALPSRAVGPQHNSALHHSVSQKQKPSSQDPRPTTVRTNTLPTHMPSLPFMGVSLQTSSASAAVSATSDSPQSKTYNNSPGARHPPATGADLSAYTNLSRPIPPGEPGLPVSLNINPNASETAAKTALELPASTTAFDNYQIASAAPFNHTPIDGHERKGDVVSSSGSSITGHILGENPGASQSANSFRALTSNQGTDPSRPNLPQHRPSTAFSVMSDFSIASEPAAQSSALPSVCEVSRQTSLASSNSPTPANCTEAPRVEAAAGFVVTADTDSAISPGSQYEQTHRQTISTPSTSFSADSRQSYFITDVVSPPDKAQSLPKTDTTVLRQNRPLSPLGQGVRVADRNVMDPGASFGYAQPSASANFVHGTPGNVQSSERHAQNPATPPPQDHPPPSNHGQSPNSRATSPSAQRTSASGTPSGAYSRKQSTQSRSSIRSASSQGMTQPSGAPQPVSSGPAPARPPTASSFRQSSPVQTRPQSVSYVETIRVTGPSRPIDPATVLAGQSPTNDLRYTQPLLSAEQHRKSQDQYQPHQNQHTVAQSYAPATSHQPQAPHKDQTQRPQSVVVGVRHSPLRPQKERTQSVPTVETNPQHQGATRKHSAPLPGPQPASQPNPGAQRPVSIIDHSVATNQVQSVNPSQQPVPNFQTEPSSKYSQNPGNPAHPPQGGTTSLNQTQHAPNTHMPANPPVGPGMVPVMMAQRPGFPQQPIMWMVPQPGMPLPPGMQLYKQGTSSQPGQPGSAQYPPQFRPIAVPVHQQPSTTHAASQRATPVKEKSSWLGGLLKTGAKKPEDSPQSPAGVNNVGNKNRPPNPAGVSIQQQPAIPQVFPLQTQVPPDSKGQMSATHPMPPGAQRMVTVHPSPPQLQAAQQASSLPSAPLQQPAPGPGRPGQQHPMHTPQQQASQQGWVGQTRLHPGCQLSGVFQPVSIQQNPAAPNTQKQHQTQPAIQQKPLHQNPEENPDSASAQSTVSPTAEYRQLQQRQTYGQAQPTQFVPQIQTQGQQNSRSSWAQSSAHSGHHAQAQQIQMQQQYMQQQVAQQWQMQQSLNQQYASQDASQAASQALHKAPPKPEWVAPGPVNRYVPQRQSQPANMIPHQVGAQQASYHPQQPVYTGGWQPPQLLQSQPQQPSPQPQIQSVSSLTADGKGSTRATDSVSAGPAPVAVSSPIPNSDVPKTGSGKNTASGGWGTTSGYDGSGWGDDDDDFA